MKTMATIPIPSRPNENVPAGAPAAPDAGRKPGAASRAGEAAPPVPRTRRQAEIAVADLARLKLAEARRAAELDARLQAVRDRFEPRLALLRQRLESKTAALRSWAEANPAQFGRFRTIQTPEGILGWRLGTPALKTLPGWNWDRALERLKSLPDLRPYLRAREEINRQRLLADRLALGSETLARLGLQVTQNDHFFVEPKLEVTKLPDRQTLAAAG